MHRTARPLLTVAICGVAFAVPLGAAGSALAKPVSPGIVVSGTDTGGAARIAQGGRTTVLVSGFGRGVLQGAAQTVLITHFAAPTPYSYSYSENSSYSYSSIGSSATGSVFSVTSVKNTVLVSQYTAQTDCGTSTYSFPTEFGASESASKGCRAQGNGTYIAYGAPASLPKQGPAAFSSTNMTYTYSVDGVVQESARDTAFCQSFNRHGACTKS